MEAKTVRQLGQINGKWLIGDVVNLLAQVPKFLFQSQGHISLHSIMRGVGRGDFNDRLLAH
jgi:hypothetical protein